MWNKNKTNEYTEHRSEVMLLPRLALEYAQCLLSGTRGASSLEGGCHAVQKPRQPVEGGSGPSPVGSLPWTPSRWPAAAASKELGGFKTCSMASHSSVLLSAEPSGDHTEHPVATTPSSRIPKLSLEEHLVSESEANKMIFFQLYCCCC